MATKRRGAREVLPQQKRGGGEVLAMLKGDTTSFGVVGAKSWREKVVGAKSFYSLNRGSTKRFTLS